MLSTTWIDVIDDIVKIGFGVALSGLFAWILARQHSKADLDKLVFDRRSQILTKVAEQYEAAFQAYSQYRDYCGGLTRRGTETTNFRTALNERLEELEVAQSHLMLLGERQCKGKAKALDVALREAELSLSIEGSVNPERYIQINRPVSEARESFYEEMTKAFEHTREA